MLLNYKLFESKKKEKERNKIKEKIQKFFDNDFITDKAIKLHPKLAVWMINQLILKTKEDGYEPIKDEVKNKLKFKSASTIKWNELNSKFISIIDWSKSMDITPQERQELTKLTFDEAYQKSKDWHDSLKAGGVIEDEYGEIIMKFDDGFYWIDLETNYCRDEANAMGHCGNTNRGTTLLSLRDRKKQPHVTVAFDDRDGIIFQMKGKNNTKPLDKYHHYIVELLINPDLKINGFGREYLKEEDFSPEDLNKDLYDKLLKAKPDIETPYVPDGEVEEIYKSYLESYYGQEPEYGFTLVKWIYDLYSDPVSISGITGEVGTPQIGMDKVIGNINLKPLIDVFKIEYPEKFENITVNLKQILNLLSRYLNPDKIATKFNIKIQGDTPSNKWDDIGKQLNMEQLFKIVVENDLLQHFQEEFGEWDDDDDNITYEGNSMILPIMDYENWYEEDVIEEFFGTDPQTQFEKLEEMFDYENRKISEFTFDVWNSWDLIDELVWATSVEDMRDEMENNDYWEYTGEY